MPSSRSTQGVEVPSPTMKMRFLLVLTLVRVSAFTTEQVEDVKTFLRLHVMVALVSVLVSDIFLIHRPIEQLIHVLKYTQFTVSE